jgi:hypothetical protein
VIYSTRRCRAPHQYQLVDIWAGDRHVSYATFLNWTFDNIAEWKAGWQPEWCVFPQLQYMLRCSI